jgi:hypothetical protein
MQIPCAAEHEELATDDLRRIGQDQKFNFHESPFTTSTVQFNHADSHLNRGVAFFGLLRYNAGMKARHAAVLALVGWYLMVPPNKNEDTPLSEWIVRRTYDSADACQAGASNERAQAAAKLRQYDNMTDLERRNLEHTQEGLDREMADNANIDVSFRAACIESGDPRLKGKVFREPGSH